MKVKTKSASAFKHWQSTVKTFLIILIAITGKSPDPRPPDWGVKPQEKPTRCVHNPKTESQTDRQMAGQIQYIQSGGELASLQRRGKPLRAEINKIDPSSLNCNCKCKCNRGRQWKKLGYQWRSKEARRQGGKRRKNRKRKLFAGGSKVGGFFPQKG